MAAWVCKGCTAIFSVGAARCPQCGSKKWVEQGAKGDPTLTAPATEDVDEVEEDEDDEEIDAADEDEG